MKRFFKPAFFVLVPVVLLVGCQASTFDLKDDLSFQQTIPVCESDDECAKVWTAARDWVMKTTPQGLAVDTDERLETLPADAEALDWETDITVKKVPVGDGTYRIVIETLCNATLNNCSAERKQMREFNEAMAAYVPAGQSQKIRRIFSEGVDMDALFDGYAASLMADDLHAHAQMYFLPATVVSSDGVRQLNSTDEVVAFLEGLRVRIGDGKIARIVAQKQRLLASTKTTSILKLQWAFFDADDDLLYTQKVIYNLVKVGDGWKIISVAIDD